jgi:hypothetical protein
MTLISYKTNTLGCIRRAFIVLTKDFFCPNICESHAHNCFPISLLVHHTLVLVKVIPRFQVPHLTFPHGRDHKTVARTNVHIANVGNDFVAVCSLRFLLDIFGFGTVLGVVLACLLPINR